ncbi:GntR family transcriptional regulator [Vibrio vulnificus]|uniref:GntR family transcriptional regulator n=1 Tax=Vibrio vulnificus TaxID=672 RepID=UPI0009C744A2|nr:GntR family transcriptional regulator [Vibrio vulnificus]EHU4926486.1 GntR family transcriptional regulator [Vibrio vulnificus]EHW0625108.1 GntR family transcriptional regulator [Vibrio vulnificus]EHW0636115.1 GntR family transcriptional regulator [Vibrio vulnificus]EID4442937.1 GntR family transcriptional regulator [Vibrio vulnificus]EIT7020787.1 GntR family transcriptional regulator [Vibrio vulnificus]
MARLPMYRQIADAIRGKISSGEYKVGDALPTEAQLREEFSVSRVTVRQAIKLLVESGELESKQGSGTYVKENKVNYDIYQQSSFAEKWSHLDSIIRSDVLAFEIRSASISMAEILQINEGDRVFYVKRVRYVDDNPITVEETWLPTEMFPDLTYQVMKGSKYDYIEKHKGLIIDRSEQEIIPVLPPQEIAILLGIDTSQPIIEKRTRSHLQDDTVFEYSRNYFKSSEYKFTLIAKRNRH